MCSQNNYWQWYHVYEDEINHRGEMSWRLSRMKLTSIMAIPALIEQLAHLPAPYVAHEWRGWQIRPIISGNNLLFRATRDHADLAIKLMIRDDRNRAQREFSALTLLESLGSPVAPRPIFLDLDSYKHAVVAQTWVDGDMLQSAPGDDATWLRILQTYHAVHQIDVDDIARQERCVRSNS